MKKLILLSTIIISSSLCAIDYDAVAKKFYKKLTKTIKKNTGKLYTDMKTFLANKKVMQQEINNLEALLYYSAIASESQTIKEGSILSQFDEIAGTEGKQIRQAALSKAKKDGSQWEKIYAGIVKFNNDAYKEFDKYLKSLVTEKKFTMDQLVDKSLYFLSAFKKEIEAQIYKAFYEKLSPFVKEQKFPFGDKKGEEFPQELQLSTT